MIGVIKKTKEFKKNNIKSVLILLDGVLKIKLSRRFLEKRYKTSC